MIKRILETKNINGNVYFKYENIDFMDLIESKRCTDEDCKEYEFRTVCPNYIKNLKYFIKYKLENLKLQMVDYKSHFKKLCFNCSASFHVSRFKDGHFNLQKMFKVKKECKSCRKRYTAERSFYHNCNICYKSFEYCQLLARHRRIEHNSKKPHQCAACHLSLSNRFTLNHHICKHKLAHRCPNCNKRFAQKAKLRLHMLAHIKEKQFSCKYCFKEYKSKQGLDLHLFEHLGGKKFKCVLCNKSFAGQCWLNQHNKRIHMEKSFQCIYCPKQYESKLRLDLHLLEHVGDKRFECDECDKSFTTQQLLNRHKHIHSEKSFQCQYCPKQYKKKQCLDIHIFEHTGSKQFKCDLCHKTFAKQFKLNKHKISHMGIPSHIPKPFQCEYCPKQYKTKQGLDIHIFEHTGSKQFKCDLCHRTFAKRFKLNKHKPFHLEKTFQCTICSRFYQTLDILRSHIRQAHK